MIEQICFRGTTWIWTTCVVCGWRSIQLKIKSAFELIEIIKSFKCYNHKNPGYLSQVKCFCIRNISANMNERRWRFSFFMVQTIDIIIIQHIRFAWLINSFGWLHRALNHDDDGLSSVSGQCWVLENGCWMLDNQLNGYIYYMSKNPFWIIKKKHQTNRF